ncbi:SLATT domain-containing protein [Motiliproteus sp. SC1-56]|uniref:SLATT domain-containing protein n=1 Tax=Motiliproteus sp. SC1-56 TaxID=2799565 RepID=UPI001A909FC2
MNAKLPKPAPPGDNLRGYLHTDPVPITWDERQLDRLYTQAHAHASETIDWYLTQKAGPKRWSRGCRMVAILGGAVGGLIPLISGAGLVGPAGWLGLDPAQFAQLGYIALALGAASLSLDRFYGYSRKWMRFMTTQHRLEILLTEFHLEWVELKRRQENHPDPAQHEQTMLARIKAFRLEVLQVMGDEMQTWIGEFQSSLAALEKRVGPERKE